MKAESIKEFVEKEIEEILSTIEKRNFDEKELYNIVFSKVSGYNLKNCFGILQSAIEDEKLNIVNLIRESVIRIILNKIQERREEMQSSPMPNATLYVDYTVILPSSQKAIELLNEKAGLCYSIIQSLEHGDPELVVEGGERFEGIEEIEKAVKKYSRKK